MNIEEEMKIWEERSNDEFGSLLKSVIKLTNEYFSSDIDEDGMTVKNPIQSDWPVTTSISWTGSSNIMVATCMTIMMSFVFLMARCLKFRI